MRLLPITGGLSLAVLLSACGAGSVSSTSPPTSTPTPTPTASNSSLTGPLVSETFQGLGVINRFTAAGGTGNVTSSQPLSSKAIQVSYDASSSSYTVVTGTLPDATFTGASKSAANSTSDITVYDKSSGTKGDNLVLFNPGSGNKQLALTYTTYGAWQTINTSTSLDVSTVFFVFGVKTATSDMPKTGTATYKSVIDGLFAGPTGIYALGGTSSLAADFGAGTVDFQMTPLGQNILTSAAKSFGTLTGSGTIAAGGSSFVATSDAQIGGSYAASLAGQFYGPQAAEFGATFQLTGPDGQGNGAMVGKKN
jgi:hypothetical protein